MTNINNFFDGMFRDAAAQGNLYRVKKSDLREAERKARSNAKVVNINTHRNESNPQFTGPIVGYLTVSEVALWLRISSSTVYRLVEEGRLEVIKLPGSNGKVLISKQSFSDFVNSCNI